MTLWGNSITLFTLYLQNAMNGQTPYLKKFNHFVLPPNFGRNPTLPTQIIWYRVGLSIVLALNKICIFMTRMNPTVQP